MAREHKHYIMYKGLERPLCFKGFKGKFIYIGVGSLLGGLIGGMVVMATAGTLPGIIVMITLIGGGLTFTGIQQKKGLSDKTKQFGIVVIESHYEKRKKDRV